VTWKYNNCRSYRIAIQSPWKEADDQIHYIVAKIQLLPRLRSLVVESGALPSWVESQSLCWCSEIVNFL